MKDKTKDEEKWTTVKVHKELVNRAHNVGINVSKICELALEKAINALEGTSGKSDCRANGGNPSSKSPPEQKDWRARRDLNSGHKLRRLVFYPG